MKCFSKSSPLPISSAVWNILLINLCLDIPLGNIVIVQSLNNQFMSDFCDAMDCSLPGSPVLRIPRQEHYSGWPFPSPGDLPSPGIEHMSSAWRVNSLPLGLAEKKNGRQCRSVKQTLAESIIMNPEILTKDTIPCS